jgi:hypothetical protein
MKRPNKAKLQAQCDSWNAANPVGSIVILSRDDGVKLRTKTKSEAQMLMGHTPVIWLEGVNGVYLLDRVRPLHGNGEGQS